MTTAGKTLTSQLWELLDDSTNRFMGIPKEDRQTPDALKAAGEARGLSKAIHVMCQPHYEDSTAVAKHAVKRFKASVAGEDMPPTPGDMTIEEAQVATVAKNEETKAKAAVARSAPTKAATPTGAAAEESGTESDVTIEMAKLNESQVKQIANGLSCDFEPSKLAELYKVSTETVEHIGVTMLKPKA